MKNPEIKYGTGGVTDLVDLRDFRYEELIARTPSVTFPNKPRSEWRKFPIFNQNGSGSCIAQSVAKILGVENLLEEGRFFQFSARDIYSRGHLKNGGMYYREGMKIGQKFGATAEQLMPSQEMEEDPMRNAKDRTTFTERTAMIIRGGNYVSLPLNVNAIAHIISQGKAVVLGVRFNSGDFNNPVIKTSPEGNYGHAITGVDYTLYNGKKAIIFDNSWGSWGYKGQGVLTEDNMQGLVVAWYYERFSNEKKEKAIEKPDYQFDHDLNYGTRENAVAKLQECLKYEGCFPIDVPCTGWYGSISKEAVKEFQEKYKDEILEPLGLDEPTGYFGESSRKKMNQLF